MQRISRDKNFSPTNDTGYLVQRACRSAIAYISLSNANIFRANKPRGYRFVGNYDLYRRLR